MTCEFRAIVERVKSRGMTLSREQIHERLADVISSLAIADGRWRQALLDEKDFLETSLRILNGRGQ